MSRIEKHIEINNGNAILVSLSKEVYGAIPLKEDLKGWLKGKEYQVTVIKMDNDRFCIMKGHEHFAETSGYLVFESLENLEECFQMKNITKPHDTKIINPEDLDYMKTLYTEK